MAVLKVEGMHCGKCVERISNALKAPNPFNRVVSAIGPPFVVIHPSHFNI